jgi:hypothetical protein
LRGLVRDPQPPQPTPIWEEVIPLALRLKKHEKNIKYKKWKNAMMPMHSLPLKIENGSL